MIPTHNTELLLNLIGFYIDQDPAPILLLQPTLEMAEAFSKDRLAPMLRDTPALQGKVADARARDSGNTLLHKTFAGGHVTLAGSNSPSSLASRPIRVVLADEIDRYPVSAGTEGDPVNLARKRSTTFWNRKLVLTSTPTVRGASRIESAYAESDQREFEVPCPHCGHFQVLAWARVHWEKSEAGDHLPATSLYVCEHCDAGWRDPERWSAVLRGRWAARAKFTGIAGFRLNELCSSWVRLEDTVRGFLEAKNDPSLLRVWTNTSLGETWEEQGEKVDETGLLTRREPWPKDGESRPLVPEKAVLLTAGVDVQDDRIEIEVVGWGADEESWSHEYIVLFGDPSAKLVWSQLDDLLLRPFRHESGVDLYIRAACIDTGGHHTQATYRFCRTRVKRMPGGRAPSFVFAVKGVAGSGPVWPKTASRNVARGVSLYLVHVDAAKDSIYSRLRIVEPGPGYSHFPLERDAEWFSQLTAEKVVTKYHRGFARREWVKARARNEALDCRVYAYSALCGLQTFGALAIERETERIARASLHLEQRANAPRQAMPQEPRSTAAHAAPPERPKRRVVKSSWMAR